MFIPTQCSGHKIETNNSFSSTSNFSLSHILPGSHWPKQFSWPSTDSEQEGTAHLNVKWYGHGAGWKTLAIFAIYHNAILNTFPTSSGFPCPLLGRVGDQSLGEQGCCLAVQEPVIFKDVAMSFTQVLLELVQKDLYKDMLLTTVGI